MQRSATWDGAMPNWCENVLQVRGIAAERAEFRRRATGDDGVALSFAGHVPAPDPYPQLEDYADSTHWLALMSRSTPAMFNDWYVWRVINWGTKWDLADEGLVVEDPAPDADDGVLTYRFVTAWSPPTPWLLAASQRHPELVFDLAAMEQSNDVGVILTVRAGVELAATEGSPQDMRDALGVFGLLPWDPDEE